MNLLPYVAVLGRHCAIWVANPKLFRICVLNKQVCELLFYSSGLSFAAPDGREVKD